MEVGGGGGTLPLSFSIPPSLSFSSSSVVVAFPPSSSDRLCSACCHERKGGSAASASPLRSRRLFHPLLASLHKCLAPDSPNRPYIRKNTDIATPDSNLAHARNINCRHFSDFVLSNPSHCWLDGRVRPKEVRGVAAFSFGRRRKGGGGLECPFLLFAWTLPSSEVELEPCYVEE